MLSEFSERVEVVPNVIDLDRYPVLESQSNGWVPVIGFSGSPSTMAVMKEIEEPLRELARENQFVLHVIGGPSAVRPEGVDLRELPWSCAQEAELLSDLDIGLAPAPNDAWNRFKFPVKILLYMAAARPVVASPVGSARDLIRDGENGFLASTPNEWLERLRYLLDDPDTRTRLGQEARRTVEQEYSLSALKPHVARIFTELVGR